MLQCYSSPSQRPTIPVTTTACCLWQMCPQLGLCGASLPLVCREPFCWSVTSQAPGELSFFLVADVSKAGPVAWYRWLEGTLYRSGPPWQERGPVDLKVWLESTLHGSGGSQKDGVAHPSPRHPLLVSWRLWRGHWGRTVPSWPLSPEHQQMSLPSQLRRSRSASTQIGRSITT